MAEWLARLLGEEFDLQDMANKFSLDNLTIIKKDDEYCLKSFAFANLTTSEEVLAVAKAIVTRLNAIGKLYISSFTPLKVNGIYRIRDDGGKDAFVFLETIIINRSRLFPLKVSKADLTVTGTSGNIMPDQAPAPKKNNFETLFELSYKDDHIEMVLEIINDGYNWQNLYKILDAIEEDLGGGKTLKSKGWVSSSEIDRFTQTANSYGAIGPNARHGKAAYKPPKKIMLFDEAKLLIETIFTKWREDKN